jgi:crotonobetainyl-CoA:carnitine CoA-transferase CaiB-like acyl-CoA transferase
MEGGTSIWWYVQSRNKKCVTLDLRKPRGQELARRLAGVADAWASASATTWPRSTRSWASS